MNSARLAARTLRVAITVLAIADGALHFSLDLVLFRGNFFGPLWPPPGAAQAAPANTTPGPPLPLPLHMNPMFLLNCIGYLVLIALFWFALRRLPTWSRALDVVFIVYVVATVLGWLDYGAPNPRGLGYLAKGVEVVLVVCLLAHVW